MPALPSSTGALHLLWPALPSSARASQPRQRDWRRRRAWLALIWLGVAACGHGGHDAWPRLAADADPVACDPPEHCTLRVHDASQAVAAGGGRVAVLRLDPSVTLQVRADAAGGCASDWAEHTGATVVFNAGFYDAERRHVGSLRSAAGWHQRTRHRDWRGLLVSDPGDATDAPRTRLLDLQREALEQAAPYREQAQSMVLFDANGALRCRNSAAAASRCVVASDADGALYVVVTQGAWQLAALATWLRQRYPTLVQAINLDGGHEAQLAVRTAQQSWDFFGEHGDRGPLHFGCRPLPYVWTLTPLEIPASQAAEHRVP